MKLELCSYELAKLAKEKGFNWGYNQFYHKNQGGLFLYDITNSLHYNLINHKHSCPAITLDLLCKWFRDVHDTYVTVETYEDGFEYILISNLIVEPFENKITANTYEKAQEQGLYKAFELI